MVQMECNQMYHLNWNITRAVALGNTHTHTRLTALFPGLPG